MSGLEDTQINWSDNYIGNQWTAEKNCFYWVSQIIDDLTPWAFPVVKHLTFYQRARVLVVEEKRNWQRIAKPSKHFDVVLMRHIGSHKDCHHIGVWTEANGGAIVHAVENDVIDVDSPLELNLRSFEIKRVLRHV